MRDTRTGRLLVLLAEGPVRASVTALRRAAGRHVATTLDVRSGVLPPDEVAGADAVLFERLGVALVNVDPRDAERSARVRAAAEENAARILAVEPERRVYAWGAAPRPAARSGPRRGPSAQRPPSRRGSPGALPPAGSEFLNRSDVRPGMIVKNDVVVKAFKNRGFDWGGSWKSLKDYQHFEAKKLP